MPLVRGHLATYEEKMTDVNIAVSLLADAQDDIYDTAMVISGDSDLSGPIEEVRRRYPGKRVVVAFPPQRVSKDCAREDRRSQSVVMRSGTASFRTDISPHGHVLIRPAEWN